MLPSILATLLPFFLFSLAIAILIIIAQWKVYQKANKPGWASIIPIYNMIILLEIVGKPVWWIVLLLIPVVNIVVAIIVVNHLSISFGKDAGFTVGMIFLPFIFYPILGFGDAKYIGPGGNPPAGNTQDTAY